MILMTRVKKTEPLHNIQGTERTALVKDGRKRMFIVDQGWGKRGLFEEYVRPSNCLLTLPYFLNYVLLVCISRTLK